MNEFSQWNLVGFAAFTMALAFLICLFAIRGSAVSKWACSLGIAIAMMQPMVDLFFPSSLLCFALGYFEQKKKINM
jgi:hypothetical protein